MKGPASHSSFPSRMPLPQVEERPEEDSLEGGYEEGKEVEEPSEEAEAEADAAEEEEDCAEYRQAHWMHFPPTAHSVLHSHSSFPSLTPSPHSGAGEKEEER